MPETKDAFVCYRSYIEAIRLLPEDKRWGFFDGILRYALDDIEPTFDSTGNIMFALMKANLDSCNKKYSASVKNGQKGGAPTGNGNANRGKKTTRSQPKQTAQSGEKTVTEDKFEMNGKLFEYYIAGDGERRVREIDRKPQ